MEKRNWIDNIQTPICSRRVYSQSNQDGVIEYIFKNIGTTNKFCIEFGFNTDTLTGGSGANVARLVLQDKWTCLLLDGDNENESINLHKEFLTYENIGDVFKKYNAPIEPDYVSIDVDSIDLWLMKGMLRDGYRPRLISSEYNINYPLEFSYTIKPSIEFKYIVDMVFGASLSALNNVAKEFDYSLIGAVGRYDLFFIRNDLLTTPPPITNFTHLIGKPFKGKTTKERLLQYVVEYPSMNSVTEVMIKQSPHIFRI